MSLDLNLALTRSPKLEMADVTAYGCEPAPLVNYANHSKKIASEYVIKVGNKKHRVYSWLSEDGTDAMYVLRKDTYNFLSDEVATMLTYGNPSYDRLTPVAVNATVIAWEREATEKFVIGQVGSDTVLGIVFTSKELAELYRGRNGLLAGWEIRKLD